MQKIEKHIKSNDAYVCIIFFVIELICNIPKRIGENNRKKITKKAILNIKVSGTLSSLLHTNFFIARKNGTKNAIPIGSLIKLPSQQGNIG